MIFGKMKLGSMFNKSGYKFGGSSEMKLAGVEPALIAVTRRALELSVMDFGITCGLRTQHEQNQLVIQGKSQIRHSRHQDGMAVDIVVYKDGKVTWELAHYIVVAEAFAKAAKELKTPLRWGGAWSHDLDKNKALKAHNAYVKLRESQNRKPFIDGPHFEIPK